MPVEGLTTARLAILVDRFKLSMKAIGRLTDRTLHEVYFHKRTKEGAIEIPMPTVAAIQEEQTKDTVLRDLMILRSFGIPDEELQRLQAEAEAKYGRQEN